MNTKFQPELPLYQQIYALVRQVPSGKVVAYGQVAKIIGRCTPRMVGYAMAALKSSKEIEEVPWQRVVNSQGRVSTFGGGVGNSIQEQLLREEGIHFDESGHIDHHEDWWIERPY